ncbi:MAG: response regulator, partial [Desulfuromonadales bacterium]|nr:response regulator [Desulfuromonadales bacterium]
MAPRVLIVEDNDQFATVVESLLRRRGLETERAGSAEAALERITASLPSVLLLDLRLPGMSGIDLLRLLRKQPRSRELPTVIMTGAFRGERYVRAAQALGVEHYLEKPFRAETLLAALRQALKPAVAAPRKFEHHLQRALNSRFTGRYRLQDPGGERTLLFVDGLPVSCQPGFVYRDLGDYLLHRGTISAAEDTYYRYAGGGRAESLVEMGCLGHGQLLREQLDHLTLELIAGFTHCPMTALAAPCPLPPDLPPVTVNLPALFYQANRQHPNPEADRQLLAERCRHYLVISANYFHRINFLPLRRHERQLLPRLDGSRTLADCLAGDESLLGLVRTLARLEMLQFAPAPLPAPTGPDFPWRALPSDEIEALVSPDEEEGSVVEDEALESFADLVAEAAQGGELPMLGTPSDSLIAPPASSLGQKVGERLTAMEGKNYYQIFGLEQGGFSFDLLKERYFQITREFGPELLMQLSGAEAFMVEEILATVTAAYNTLSDVVKKERYDELLGSEKIGLGEKGDDHFRAEVQFQSAKVFLEMQEWDSAEKALQDACNIKPENGVYLAYLAWSLYCNPVHASSRAMLDKARQTINRALTMERSADGFAFKGRILLDLGQDSLAEVELSKALKLDARNQLARAGLRQLQERREQEKKGCSAASSANPPRPSSQFFSLAPRRFLPPPFLPTSL